MTQKLDKNIFKLLHFFFDKIIENCMNGRDNKINTKNLKSKRERFKNKI